MSQRYRRDYLRIGITFKLQRGSAVLFADRLSSYVGTEDIGRTWGE